MIGFAFSNRLAAPLIGVLGLTVLGGCDNIGLSGRDAELARQAAGDFYVVEASHKGAVIAARGRKVAVEPASGFCLARDSIETSRRSVFILIGDCAVAGPATENTAAGGRLSLPKAVPGIMTVSISGDPGFRARDGSFDKLREFLKSTEGMAMLGRSGSGRGVAIRESREMDGALMLYLEDNSTDIVPILSNKFWRAFVELNGRLTVVTISGFRDRPLGREKMLSYLISQVQTLGAANASPLGPAETLIARADPPPADPAKAALAAADEDAPRPLSDVRAEAGAAAVTATTAGAPPASETPAATAETPAPAPPVAGTETPVAPETPVTIASAERPEVRARGGGGVVLPPRRPGSTAPAATFSLTDAAGAPAAAGSVPPVPRGDDGGATARPPADDAASAPDPVSGPATKHAPRTAPIAPRRRPG